MLLGVCEGYSAEQLLSVKTGFDATTLVQSARDVKLARSCPQDFTPVRVVHEGPNGNINDTCTTDFWIIHHMRISWTMMQGGTCKSRRTKSSTCNSNGQLCRNAAAAVTNWTFCHLCKASLSVSSSLSCALLCSSSALRTAPCTA